MCLIITTICAIISTLIWFFKARDRKYKIGMLSLMYWGASIMWLADSIFAVAGGEGFFNISVNDTLLGLVIAASGIVAWLVAFLFSKAPKKDVK